MCGYIVNEDLNHFIINRPLKMFDLIFSFWAPYPNNYTTTYLLNHVKEKAKGLFFHAHRRTKNNQNGST